MRGALRNTSGSAQSAPSRSDRSYGDARDDEVAGGRAPASRDDHGGRRGCPAAERISPASMICHRDDEGENQLGSQVAQPYSSWLWQPNLANGHQPSNAGEKHTQSKQIHQRSLLSDGDCCPEVECMLPFTGFPPANTILSVPLK